MNNASSQRQLPSKPVIGIVGAPGSGKSTVARQFARLGAAVIDADQISHELLAEPEIIEKIVGFWGKPILDPDGSVNRKALGNIVFNDETELKKLTDLIHPLVAQREQELIDAYQKDADIAAIVLDVPLLIEVGHEKWCDCLVVVKTHNSIRHKRLKEKFGWDGERIKKVENSQIALDIKEKMSEHTVCNNSSIPDLAAQAAEILPLVLEKKRTF